LSGSFACCRTIEQLYVRITAVSIIDNKQFHEVI
jgi:hypothetical protein